MLVRNTGQVVDQFTIDVVGNCAEWTKVEPKVVNLLPGADVEVTITFAPARSPQVAAGVVPFGVRVMSREDPAGSTVAEGSVEVAPFSDVQIEIVPRQSKGRRRGKHQVAIDNNGNLPTTVQVTATDEEEALDFALDHSVATIEPGSAAFIRLVAKPEKRFFKGADRQHPFIVTVAPSNADPVATRGTMTQRQLLPAWLIPAVAILAALAIAAVILYETLLKPKIESQAQDAAISAASKANKSLASKANQAQSQAAAANAAAKKAQSDASAAKSAAGAGGGSKVATTPPGGTGPSGSNIDIGSATSFALTTDVAPTLNDFTTFTTIDAGPALDNKHLLVITAVVLQNPNGDTGTLRIVRGPSEILLNEGLANFRDLDHHFDDEPIIFSKSKPLQLAINCQKTSTTRCHVSVLFTGRVATIKSAP
jgi:hypothetical protein